MGRLKPWRLVAILDKVVRLERFTQSGRLEVKTMTHEQYLALS